MPFTVSLSMTLGDFIDVLQHNGYAALARRVTSQDLSPSHQRPSESDPDPATNSRARPAVHFPLELTPPSPINLPAIPRDGRGRAVTYATLATLKVIADGVASDPKHAFEFLASRYTENWSMLLR